MTMIQSPKCAERQFQLTSSRRGWHRELAVYDTTRAFQLTSSRRGWLIREEKKIATSTFQLTSSRRGWHQVPEHLKDCIRISTHILTKRMTRGRYRITESHGISTHILTKRMTILQSTEDLERIFQLTSSRRGWQGTVAVVPGREYFNSHPHEEDDNSLSPETQEMIIISTHILTKRMTAFPTLF